MSVSLPCWLYFCTQPRPRPLRQQLLRQQLLRQQPPRQTKYHSSMRRLVRWLCSQSGNGKMTELATSSAQGRSGAWVRATNFRNMRLVPGGCGGNPATICESRFFEGELLKSRASNPANPKLQRIPSFENHFSGL